MQPIFHITSRTEALEAGRVGEYVPAGFDVDGFIHCSYAHQLAQVADRHFRGRSELVVFEIDRAALSCDVIDENLEGGAELFPHIYGRLPMAAVVRTHDFSHPQTSHDQAAPRSAATGAAVTPDGQT